ncbi:hypothetical protein RJG79_08510 [Mycoplasmatota bacterium WC44]
MTDPISSAASRAEFALSNNYELIRGLDNKINFILVVYIAITTVVIGLLFSDVMVISEIIKTLLNILLVDLILCILILLYAIIPVNSEVSKSLTYYKGIVNYKDSEAYLKDIEDEGGYLASISNCVYNTSKILVSKTDTIFLSMILFLPITPFYIIIKLFSYCV